jgi:ribosomal protein S27AE
MKSLRPEKFTNVHTDDLSCGKCLKCNLLKVWFKKDKIKLTEAFCVDCNSKLERTTFLSKLAWKENK